MESDCMIKIDEEKCLRCLACISVCPSGALEEKDGVPVVNDKCTDCGKCIEACPADAISK